MAGRPSQPFARPETKSPLRRSVSFAGFESSSAIASRAMRSNRRTGTVPERLLARALRSIRLSFASHASELPGTPDFVFARARVVVFCDGDFWHGRNWRVRRASLIRGANPDYWIPKILSNRRRDRVITRRLEALDWGVLRVWESEVRRSPTAVARRIESAVRQESNKRGPTCGLRVRPG